MISKDQFLELKHLKSLGVPTTTIAKKIGISVPSANKWLRLDEEAFENYLRNNTPYLEQYRAFIISILKICPQTPATNTQRRSKSTVRGCRSWKRSRQNCRPQKTDTVRSRCGWTASRNTSRAVQSWTQKTAWS